jgi:glycerol-3-phosphate acyltransferase PlsY
MPWFYYLLAIIIGYLIGSIPFGYMIGKTKGIDITTLGSGRTGGTNVFRALGKKWGLLSGLLDVFKGVAAVLLVQYLFADNPGMIPGVAPALAGAFAVVGHNWSIFLRFRGGAGGATGAGALLALNPTVGLILIVVFVILMLGLRYASVATMTIGIGSLLVLFLFYLVGWHTPAGHLLFGVIVAVAITWSLRPNIKRLIAGNERRITL